METKLDEIDERLQDLEEQAKGKEAGLKAPPQNEVEDLKEKQKSLRNELDYLK
jgi:hypothetical protein